MGGVTERHFGKCRKLKREVKVGEINTGAISRPDCSVGAASIQNMDS